MPIRKCATKVSKPKKMFDDNMTYTLDDFESSKMVLLGEGSYGKVYRAFDQRTGKTVAIKHLIHWGEDDDSKTEQKHFIREISMQSRLKHPCILPFIGFSLPSISENQVTPPFIVTEFMKNGTLQDYANLKNAAKCKSFDWTLRFKAIYGIASGMAFCHGMEVVHRDLKPENIFLDENLEPKIADFGLARAFGNETFFSTTASSHLSPILAYPKYTKLENLCHNRCFVALLFGWLQKSLTVMIIVLRLMFIHTH